MMTYPQFFNVVNSAAKSCRLTASVEGRGYCLFRVVKQGRPKVLASL
ncbi:hypothetical protein Sulac_1053 [Sulfobacillus acidophilus DSM 10332]|uniref:Uncharacterized protein n=1 Tax=Sulfobacillus acidophilus (strain ATCC 700253 / DSM 10332 / NAL) TaxID=679936 RepID=G8TTW2_SULAD|nr:hypothetical protein Sulac_1053 [Sulfobacillus acidophilus DSM 10332]